MKAYQNEVKECDNIITLFFSVCCFTDKLCYSVALFFLNIGFSKMHFASFHCVSSSLMKSHAVLPRNLRKIFFLNAQMSFTMFH